MKRSFRLWWIGVLGCLFLIGHTGQASSQSPESASDAGLDSTAFVPQFSLAAIRIQPQPLLKSARASLMPVEVAEAWSKENFGLDLSTIQEIRAVVGMPMGPGEPPVGALISLTADYDPSEIKKEMLLDPPTQMVGDRKVFRVGEGRQEYYIHSVDPRHVLVAVPTMFTSMLNEPNGAGPLAELIRQNPLGQSDVQAIVALEPVQPMLAAAAQQAASILPPQLSDLTRVPELLQAVVAAVRLSEDDAHIQAELVCRSEDDASELQTILTDAISFGRERFVQQMNQQIVEEGPIADAQRAYAKRLADQIVQLITPQQRGDHLVLEQESALSVASSGMLVGLLLPAVQAARGAARRMSASNDLKQIGLALHNYHDAYRALPAQAILDDNGKPLLSWRVAILPFIEQAPLYEQFHLDEPWDSPHNIQLLEKMPETYADPGVSLQPGETVYHAVVGDQFIIKPLEPTRFREVTDGLSNTIMVAEVAQDEAVPWSAPQDVEIDMDNPVAVMGDTRPGGFNALMGDGSVQFIASMIDTDVFRSLLTRAGGEAVTF